jgi:hypothetical protein
MKRNYGEIVEKLENDIEDNFYDELVSYQSECFSALDILEEDYWNYNEGDLRELDDLLKKIPDDVFVADANIVHDFALIFARFYVDVKNNDPRSIRKQAINNFLDLKINDILVVINEIAFFNKITGVLENEMEGTRGYFFYDVPFELRRSWIIEKHLEIISEKDLVLSEEELNEEIENCLEFLTYCSVMHGVSQKGVSQIRPHLEHVIQYVDDKEIEIETHFKNRKFNFKCDDKLFFIIYFSTIFQHIYKMQKKESYELLVYLYNLLFDRNDPLIYSDDKDELIKKRIKSEFGGKANTNSLTVRKIKALAKLRVKSLTSVK